LGATFLFYPLQLTPLLFFFKWILFNWRLRNTPISAPLDVVPTFSNTKIFWTKVFSPPTIDRRLAWGLMTPNVHSGNFRRPCFLPGFFDQYIPYPLPLRQEIRCILYPKSFLHTRLIFPLGGTRKGSPSYIQFNTSSLTQL